MERLEDHGCFGGRQQVWRHASQSTGTPMRFSIYLPPAAAAGERSPVMWFLSGLTCTEQNFIQKAGAQRVAAELGLIVVGPDTSPRGDDVARDPEGSWSLGESAGYYVDATAEPWARHYRMRTYVEQELPALVAQRFPADTARQGVCGHSMGGHGALTLALRNPGRFRSVSCTAPISAPMTTPWGERALAAYLGPDRQAWRPYDATALLDDGARCPHILVDQGEDDEFMDRLRPDLLEAACARAGQPLTLRRHPGYDHSFYFVATFMEDHLRWHARSLLGAEGT
jgi:S-formylglutathione hydrolase